MSSMTYTVREEAEWIQRTAWASQYAAAPPEFAAATGMQVLDLAPGVTQFLLPAVPFRMFNRVLGLGVSQPVEQALIQTALANFADAGVENFAITLGPDDAAPLGLTLTDEWAVLTRGVEPAPTQATELTLTAADPETFGRVLCQGYEMPESVAVWGAGITRQPGWHMFLAWLGETPIGCAGMFIQNGAAWFGPAATLTGHRGHGAQTALFAHRITEAATLGCHLLVTEALPDTPRTPNPSYRNMLRAGFAECFRHLNYGKQP